jgi:uncharacterized protein (TIGR02145 family)
MNKMKSKYWASSFFVIELLLILINSCNKEKPFTLPVLSTVPLTDIKSTSVISGGNITSDGGEIVISRGVCWGKSPNPTVSDNITSNGAGAGTFLSPITGLTSGTDYYLRAYATNNEGTAYGNEFIFILPVTDIDGNVYNPEIIGTQVWITENLKTTKYNDNTIIPMIPDNTAWAGLSSPAYCWYKHDNNFNENNYGALYNWFAVNTGKLCPIGWHVPNDDEWTILINYVGGENIASGELKESGTAHWISPNWGASNEFGFNALPGGYRTGNAIGSFRYLGYYGWWWASSEYSSTGARACLMAFDESDIIRGNGLKKNGYSVRCLKDN